MKIVCLFTFSVSSSSNSTEVDTLSTNLVDKVRLSFVEKVKNNSFSQFVRFTFTKETSEIPYNINTTYTGQNYIVTSTTTKATTISTSLTTNSTMINSSGNETTEADTTQTGTTGPESNQTGTTGADTTQNVTTRPVVGQTVTTQASCKYF